MGGIRATQTNFTAGELDPLIAARIDIDQYSAGAEQLRNVVVVPQGGVMRRAGLKYIAAKAGSQVGVTRLLPFEFAIDEAYVFVMQDDVIEIYRDDELEQTLDHDYTTQQIQELYFCQSADTMILLHADVPPQKILRDTTEPLGSQFSIAELAIDNIPFYDFKDADSPSPVDEQQRITFGGGWQTGEEFRLVLDGLRTPRIIYSSDSAILRSRIEGALRDLANTSAAGITVDDETDGLDPEGKFLVTFGGADGGKDWPDIQPRLSETATGGITVAEVIVGGTTSEIVWSATRGYPACGVFHEDRLWLAGSRSRPATLWASVTGRHFDFDLGDGIDDDAIEVTLGGQHVQTIYHLAHGRTLEVYTESGEWYTADAPITPANVAFVKQSDVGSRRRQLIPQAVDGVSIFVDRVGKGVFQFVYTYSEDAYNAEEISTISQHLIRDPISLAVNRENRGNYVYVVNSDGTMAVLSLHRSQQVAAWSLFSTEGLFRQVVSVGREVYVTVTRTLPGPGVQTTLERFDVDYYMDCATKRSVGTPTDTFAGLTHLAAADVEVIGDDTYQGAFAVGQAGVLRIDNEVSELEVGLAYRPNIRPMPAAPTTQSGSTRISLRRMGRVWLRLLDSRHVTVNGYRVAERQLDRPGTLDNPSGLLNGDYETRLLGYSRTPRLDITQDGAGPLTLLAVSYDRLEAN